MTRFSDDTLVPLAVVVICAAGLAVASQLEGPPRKIAKPPAGAVASNAAGRTAQPAPSSEPRAAIAPITWQPQPDPSAALIRIGFGSCLVQGREQPIWRAVVAAEPQLFLMMGDNVYGDFKIADAAPLKAAYDTLTRDADFRQATTAIPMLATWDDHDYGLNDGGADFAHKAVAAGLFEAFWAGSGTLEGARGPGISYARTYGPEDRRVQIIMLDTRSFRSPLKRKPEDDKAKGRYVPDDSADKTLLGAAQWAWLEAQLEEPADLRLIVSSIQVIAEGHRWERWGNLAVERTKLFDLIRAKDARNVIFLSGDRHRAGLYRLQGVEGLELVEATSSSLNRSFDDPAETGPHQIGQMFGGNNFGILEIDWAARSARLSIRDDWGKAQRELTVPLKAP